MFTVWTFIEKPCNQWVGCLISIMVEINIGQLDLMGNFFMLSLSSFVVCVIKYLTTGSTVMAILCKEALKVDIESIGSSTPTPLY